MVVKIKRKFVDFVIQLFTVKDVFRSDNDFCAQMPSSKSKSLMEIK